MTLPTYLDTHVAIVGASGAGKTVTAKDQVEALLDARRHVCIVDPTGVWWGLRSDAAGDGPGFDIPVFGGPRGDVQITPSQGEAIGAIIAGGVSAVVDVSEMDSDAQIDFALGLVKALRKKPRANFHFIVDEMEEFAPQTAPSSAGQALIREMTWIAKRGRSFGFVLTAITQRPADISKAVLSQMQTLMAHQLILPHDQAAVQAYLKSNGDKATLDQIMKSLPGLQRGERWIYSPRLGLLERGVSDMPRTFDSSRTPEPGEMPIEPKMLASIDLGEIRKALAPVELTPVPSDPVEAYAAGSEAGAMIAERDATIASLREQIETHIACARGREKNIKRLIAERDALILRLNAIRAALQEDSPGPPADEATPAKQPNEGGSNVDRSAARAPASRDTGPRRAMESAAGEGSPASRRGPSVGLNAAARKMIEMLDRIAPARVTWTSLAAMVGNKARGGNFNAARKAMRESGLIVEDGDTVRSAAFTQAKGMLRANAIDLWKSVLSNPAPRMITALAGGGLTRGDLGEALGIAPRGGNFNNGVAQLIRNGVAVDRGGVLHLAEPLPGEGA